MTTSLTAVSDATQRFTRALGLALYDSELERRTKRPLRYYYDTDVLVKIIKGFRELEQPGEYQSRAVFARALLSAGFLGPMHMLRPHALELDDHLRREPSLDIMFERDRRVFLQREGLETAAEELRRLIGRRRSDPQRLGTFIDRFQELAPQAFVAMELAYGPWQRRVARLHKEKWLRLDDLGPELGEVLVGATDELWYFNGELFNRRGNGLKSLNNLRDAVSLAALGLLVNRGKSNPASHQVRFCTETTVLRDIIARDARAAPLLTYELLRPHDAEPEDIPLCGSVLRDWDYFIIRATFDILTMPESVGRSSPPLVSLDSLKSIYLQLRALVRHSTGGTASVLEAPVHGTGKAVGQLIEDFERLSFLSSCIARYPVRQEGGYLPELVQVGAYAREVTDEVQREIFRVRKALHEEVSGLQGWLTNIERVQYGASLRKATKGLRSAGESFWLPDPLRDVGLVRWGLVPNARKGNEIAERITSYLRDLLGGRDDIASARACGTFAAFAESVGDNETDCVVACAVLWLLDMHECIVRVIDACKVRSNTAVARGLRAMGAAAAIMSYEHIEVRKVTASLDRLYAKTVKTAAIGENRGYALLGFAYAAYLAWERCTGGWPSPSAGDSSKTCAVRSLVERSFTAAKQAEEELPRRSLAWAFAVNHCAYLRAVAQLGSLADQRYEIDLLSLVGERRIWNYRFADTCAWIIVCPIRRRWEEIQSDGSVDARQLIEFRRVACPELERAARWFEESPPRFNDPKFSQHEFELEALRRAIGCFGHSYPERSGTVP